MFSSKSNISLELLLNRTKCILTLVNIWRLLNLTKRLLSYSYVLTTNCLDDENWNQLNYWLCFSPSLYNRYIAVTHPIKYARHKSHKRVWLTIGLVWAISAAIGLPIVLGLNDTPSRDQTLCMFYNSDFVIYSSLSSFYIPCIIMVFLYYKIFKVKKNSI